MKSSLGISNFLEEIFPILLFFSISLHWSLRKAFLSLLAILWNSAFRWIYLSFSPLPFASLLFTAICKASSDNHFAFLHFFSWGWSWSLSPVQCHESAFPSARDPPNPGIELRSLESPTVAGRFFTTVQPGKLAYYNTQPLRKLCKDISQEHYK